MVEDEPQGVVTTTTAPAKPAAKQGGFKFFAATLFLVGIVSVGAQFAAASTNGISEYVTLGSPTGPGLIAIIAGVVMGAKCRSWESWRKWIWLPLVVAVTLMFVVMGFTAQSVAREQAQEEAHQAEIAQACQALGQQIEAKAAEIDAYRYHGPVAGGVPEPSWVKERHIGDFIGLVPVAAIAEHDRLRAQYDASC